MSVNTHGRPSRSAVGKLTVQDAFDVATEQMLFSVGFRDNPSSLVRQRYDGTPSPAASILTDAALQHSPRYVIRGAVSCVRPCVLFFITREVQSSGARVIGPDAASVWGDPYSAASEVVINQSLEAAVAGYECVPMVYEIETDVAVDLLATFQSLPPPPSLMQD
ncbi:hypothetical protein LZ32DRAFT_654966 [Colletotrichum eremochloae]|nr:hypothetical protein LZ32DRAFT_654966 [Colletotrichum eremochloae]